jgi:hypothetical protein
MHIMLKTTKNSPAKVNKASVTGIAAPSFTSKLKKPDELRIREVLNLGPTEDLPQMALLGYGDATCGLMVMTGEFQPSDTCFPLKYLGTTLEQSRQNPELCIECSAASTRGVTCYLAYLDKLQFGYVFHVNLVPIPPDDRKGSEPGLYRLEFKVVALCLTDLEHLPALLDTIASGFETRQIQLKDQYHKAKALPAPHRTAHPEKKPDRFPVSVAQPQLAVAQ